MMVRLGRSLGQGASARPFQGIRFRIGLAMALALLPILLLAAIQTQSNFRDQAEARRSGLQLAAERSAAGAKSRLDSTAVLLQALRPESLQFFCEPRLSALVDRLESLDGLARISATGQQVCASSSAPSSADRDVAVRGSDWFARLRGGESMVLARAPVSTGSQPNLIVAIRLERPMGTFDGAMIALIPLASLQPDTSDRALPEGSEAALTDGDGNILTATDAGAFVLGGGRSLQGWVQRARDGSSAVFEADDREGRHRDYAGAALAGRDVYVLLSAPAPGLLSWARLNPVGVLILPLAAWLTAFAAVMLVSERIIIRWLDYLERVAAIYARGRFSVRPLQAVNAPSEIRLLASTLDTLAETIIARDKALTDSLSEKDALMREIHHRVKNNLQIISSLLSMQQRTLTDGPARAAVGDTRQRIAALALIYRTLYQSDDLRYADARIFLTDLVGQLVASATGQGPVITSSVEADSLVVDPDKLAPLALWLVEAVTNAQKHAFAGRGGDLKVRFQVRGDTSVLEVEDDGPGVDETRQAGVGRTLMGAFAKQLRGTAEIVPSPSGGSIARMVFATPEAVTPVDPADLGTPRVPAR
ncbi:MAG: two-component sensor histidine kinase [Brevundimonas sp.]|jgi:two-component sensor histidine kinase|uniref:sensor histidine kinase PhyK n=1 Tax=Brevundimonas sp. TaxID=1871086 RepID=UPI0024887FE4|nr:sensor histidine kinase [Brevundimonas sp.]MDI1280492.1 sensor histidine kinase [Brevundimonas sp.]